MKYTLKRSRRAKYMRLRVLPGGTVILTVPHRMGASAIESFLVRQGQWLRHAIARMMQFKALPVSGRRAYLKHKEDARAFVCERALYWNQRYGYTYQRIAIKNSRRTWGSCSRKGNLNFSYALLFLPRELADYVIVHELCHLKERNHAKDFWKLVAHTLPNYIQLRRELRRYLPRG